jgi:hypothetical protein
MTRRLAAILSRAPALISTRASWRATETTWSMVRGFSPRTTAGVL